MRTIALLGLAILAGGQARAQQSIRILTPTNDSCAAYTKAMETGDATTVAAFGGWTAGFVSGVAQGTGIDFLRNEEAEKLFGELYANCLSAPSKLLSLAAEERARALIEDWRRTHP
jgi:hypothetical protein